MYYTVKKLYKESSNRTSFLVKESYTYRIIDEIVKGKNDCDDIKAGINNYSSKDEFFKVEDISCSINNNDISYVEFKIEDKKEKYYFYKEEN